MAINPGGCNCECYQTLAWGKGMDRKNREKELMPSKRNSDSVNPFGSYCDDRINQLQMIPVKLPESQD